MNIVLKGLTRILNVVNLTADQQEQGLQLNARGDVSVVHGLPERAELSRLGFSFGAAIPTASAFTFVATWPTTRAELVLYNGETAGVGKSYVIDRCWLSNVTSQAAAQPYSLLGQIYPSSLGVAAAADNTAVIRHALKGNVGSTISSQARLALANTAFATTNNWFLLGNAAVSPMTTNLANGLSVECYGRYIIPPQSAFCLAGLAGTAAGTAICGVEWHEVQLPI